MEDLINDDLIIRYLTGNANCEEEKQVEQWCAVDDDHQKILEQLYFTLQVSDRLRVMKSADHHKGLQQLKDRIRRKEITARRRLVMHRLQRVAAILLLPVITLSAWLLLQKNTTQAPPMQYIELHANPGMVATFELPDGSKVWLNGGSRLRYPLVFSGNKREVQMSGQGYFEIAHNTQQPFTVSAGESFSLEVLGTSFNLTAYEDEDVIETTLVEGSVKLMMKQQGKMAQRMMKPNEKLVYNKVKESDTAKIVAAAPQTAETVIAVKEVKPESVKIATVDPQYDIAWKDRRILFRNHPMEEVIRTLGRYYNVQFTVKNAKVMESVITGKFSNEPLSQVMEYIRIASGIKYKIIPAVMDNEEQKPGIVEIWK